ncbi:gephyrin-like molybdotransferase Glp [Zoogloea sp.]|uniref:molybdopterin molybdotransferase MoeA n=1 Tax=Zoogloea sp. TaxID=49181 RepID=UPI0035B28763
MTDTLADQFGCHTDYDPSAMPVDLARKLLLDTLSPVEGTETLPLSDALGRILAVALRSPLNVPPHDNSAMDGYGLRGADLVADAPVRLRVVGAAFAGQPCDVVLGAGEAVRIMTGAKLPAGVDTVVMQEVVQTDGDWVVIPAGQRPGQNVRKAGEDLAEGGLALAAGTLIRPAELGLLASIGIAEVQVRRRLKVAIFSTGDEVTPIGTPLKEGGIYDSNRYSLFGLLSRLGVEVIDGGVLKDDPVALEAAFREAARIADVVLTSGGVSVGEADFTRDMMARLGEVLFWKISMKPGRPMAFGRIGQGSEGAWLFGLPGNPVAVMVTFYQFARPALMRLAGQDPVPEIPTLKVQCTSPIRKQPGRTEFQRGVLYPENGAWKVRTTGAQGSGMLSSMATANCFIVLPENQGRVDAGAWVEVQVLDGIV